VITRPRTALAAIAATSAIALVALAGCGGSVPDGGVAQVGNQVISQGELDNALSQQKAAAQQQKQTFPEPGTDQYNALAQQALQGLIFQRIVDQEAQKCGAPCTVSKARVKAELNKVIKTNFSNDKKQFEDFLKKSGLTDADAERIIRTNLEQPKLLARVTKGITYTREQALAYCKAHPQEFKKTESREASHILVKTRAEADRIRALVNSSNFAALAKQYSIDPGSKLQGGSLGAITRGTLVPEFEKVAFSLGDGEISQPVKTQFGWHIITVKITPARQVPCSEAAAGIITQQLQMKKATAEQKWRTKLLKDWESRITYSDDSLKPSSTTG
jgi:foldase protein PrsA